MDKTGEAWSQHASGTAPSQGQRAHNRLDPGVGAASSAGGKDLFQQNNHFLPGRAAQGFFPPTLHSLFISNLLFLAAMLITPALAQILSCAILASLRIKL